VGGTRIVVKVFVMKAVVVESVHYIKYTTLMFLFFNLLKKMESFQNLSVMNDTNPNIYSDKSNAKNFLNLLKI